MQIRRARCWLCWSLSRLAFVESTILYFTLLFFEVDLIKWTEKAWILIRMMHYIFPKTEKMIFWCIDTKKFVFYGLKNVVEVEFGVTEFAGEC